MKIAYTCKICKKQGVAEHADDCPPEWVSALSGMLTHDTCADNRREYLDTQSKIARLCSSLERMKMISMDTTDAAMLREKIKTGLTIATKRYTEVIGRIYKLYGALWAEDFVDQLMEYPAKVDVILKTYRKLLREAVNPKPVSLPHAD